jgi:hypothetical protein
MNTKLTLTIDHQVIEAAKDVARQSGRSLSDLIEHYLIALIRLQHDKASAYTFSSEDSLMVADSAAPVYSSRLLGLKGIAKDDGRDYKEQLGELRKNKHLK